MLGALKSHQEWKWAAFGKHPVAGDYFNAGPDDPIFKAFSGWVENGYRQVSADRKNATDPYSWRFWARGRQKDTLMFGVGRDSFDTIGRPYPLVIMGTGTLSGWQRHLAAFPFALEKLWIQMEYLATKRYLDVSQIEAEIQRLAPPEADWSAFQAEQQRRWELCPLSERPVPARIRQQVAIHADTSDFLVPLKTDACMDPSMATSLWFDAMVKANGTVPNAAFLGGGANATYLALFMRPLVISDFVTLWTVSGREP